MNKLGTLIFASLLGLLSLDPVYAAPGGGKIFIPSKDGKYPAVLVLHSKAGLTKHETEYAQKLCLNGYVALTVNYFTGEGNNTMKGYEYLTNHPNVDPTRIGAVGFSRGAREALDLASRLSLK